MTLSFNPTLFDKLENQLAPITIENNKTLTKSVFRIINDNDLKVSSAKKLIPLLHKVYTVNSVRTYLKAFTTYLKLVKRNKTKYFKVYMDEIERINVIQAEPKQLTEKQSKVDYNKGVNKFLQFILDNDYELKQDEMFLLSFYFLQPPRRLDYLNMYFSDKIETDKEKNWLVRLGKDDWMFVFNQFKTLKGFKQQIIPIDNNLLVKILENKELKVGEKLYKSSKRTFQRRVQDITDTFFGQLLNVQDIRVLYSSEKFKPFQDFIKMLEEDSFRMAHKLSTKITNYIRIRR